MLWAIYSIFGVLFITLLGVFFYINAEWKKFECPVQRKPGTSAKGAHVNST